MTPPWPNKTFNLLGHSVPHLTFSPSGSQLAFCIDNRNTGHDVVHVWDRWGKETLLGYQTRDTHCLEYSLDGEYLASGSGDGSIRIWSRESCDTTSSHTYRERPTRTPKQADKILTGGRHADIKALSFSRTDSNLLASGGWNGESNGEIKVWNVNEQACIHSLESRGPIRSVFFAGGADSACVALTSAMSIIRLWRTEGSSDFASETMGERDRGGLILIEAVFSPSGSFLAAIFYPRPGRNESTVASYEIETMTKTQSVVIPGCIAACVAVSPDSKQLVFGDYKGTIQLLQTDDLSIQRDLDTTGEAKALCSVAFDPTCRVLAFGYHGGELELRSL
jgi:WD40 repeat protein